jgi:hypothetical protein
MAIDDELIKDIIEPSYRVLYDIDGKNLDITEFVLSIDTIVFDESAIIISGGSLKIMNDPRLPDDFFNNNPTNRLDTAYSKKCAIDIVVNSFYKRVYIGKIKQISFEGVEINITLRDVLSDLMDITVGNDKNKVSNMDGVEWKTNASLASVYNPADIIKEILLLVVGQLFLAEVDIKELVLVRSDGETPQVLLYIS